MTVEEYKRDVNPCYGCDCLDEDMGCTMPLCDRVYACSLENDEFVEAVKKEGYITMSMRNGKNERN